jgi:hypothetical protein
MRNAFCLLKQVLHMSDGIFAKDLNNFFIHEKLSAFDFSFELVLLLELNEIMFLVPNCLFLLKLILQTVIWH